TPPVSFGQKLPVAKGNGDGALGPGEQGFATWTVEGLLSGTHALHVDIEGDLLRPGRETLHLAGSAQALVEVVDPRFHLTFSHPDVVREGEGYSLYLTVANLSPKLVERVNVSLGSVTGAQLLASPGEIPSIAAGAAETIEFRLKSQITGRCFATTGQTDSANGIVSITLYTGVGEHGIPLSPASLVLPRFSELLPSSILVSNVRLLGLAYSLASAPQGLAPAGLPRVITSDVVRRAVDLGEAGQRLFLKDGMLESLEVLALDQLGNRDVLEEYDALRR